MGDTQEGKTVFPLSWEGAVKKLRASGHDQVLVRAAYYDDPLIDAAERYRLSDEWRAVLGYFPSGEKLAVLDVGAGRGIATYALAKDGHCVTALEPDESSIVGSAAIRELAEQAGLEVKITDALSSPLPYPDQSFDVVFARAVLHHIEDLDSACLEFYRVLRPGGKLIAVREHVLTRMEDLAEFLDKHPLHRYYGGEHAYQLSDYLDAINRAGFTIQRKLAPLDSPINYGPSTTTDVQREIAKRLSLGLPILNQVFTNILRVPGFWSISRRLILALDNRPGRLYSFIAEKRS